jgi:uncharacterized protein (TIGR00730 family)
MQHRDTHEQLAQMVHEGGRTLPESHDRSALVCKPVKVEAWRIFRIMSEFIEGFNVIRHYTLAVTFFGSVRTSPDDPLYKEANELAARLSKAGFAIVTGGSAGIMQAANKGAFDLGGASIGLNISLPAAQNYNPYLTDKYLFDHFFVRKVMLTYASEVYIYFPGGFGTLDEFFEIITLVQIKKIRRIPIVLFGREYWDPLTGFIEKVLYEKYANIDKEDLELYKIVDSVDEAYEYVTTHVTCEA